MNLIYFKSQICEELQGSRDYVKLAIATRVTDPMWSKHFAQISANELDHANSLFKMAEEFYTKLPERDRAGKNGELYRCIVNLITEDGAKIRWMHETLNQQPSISPQTVTPTAPLVK